MKSLVISKKEAGQRLDKYLQKYLSMAPKSFLYKMLRKKNIVLNGKKADGSEKLRENDEVRLYLADDTVAGFQKAEELAPYRKLSIAYEDSEVLIVNKPIGMLSQKAREKDWSLNEYVISYLIHSGQLKEEALRTFRPGICNRLDRNTSGLVIAGKTVRGLQCMSELIRERDVEKYYLCMVNGQIDKGMYVKGYLYKDEKKNRAVILKEPCPGAVSIETEYEPIDGNGLVTLLKVHLITGKSHQIRSHLASCGHGIVGDTKYGKASANERYKRQYGLKSQFLHAWQLRFPKLEEPFMGLSEKVVKAPVPELFSRVLKGEQLGGKIDL